MKTSIEGAALAIKLNFNEEILKMAHDMRAPMAALMAVIDTPGDIDQNRKILAKKAIWRALHLIESILVHNQKQTLENDYVSVNDSITSMIEEKKLLCPKHIKIEFTEDHKSVFLEQSKIKQMERVLCNVIQNAMQALEAQPAGKIRIHIKTRYTKTHIRIEDNGPGIPPHIRRKIGIMPVTYMKQGGHGIGLMNSKKIMNNMGGRLMIRSRSGQGTTVTLVI